MHIFEVSIFGISIAPTWYGFMYALGFMICFEYMARYSQIRRSDMDMFLFFIFIWVIWWWRLWYVVLYQPTYFIAHPLEILEVWNGGMSFHGGAIGVIIALIAFAKKYKYQLLSISDTLVTILPLALGLWRIGNSINKELLGYSPYTGPLAIIKDGISYFPSPLLQACLEGIVLLSIMQIVKHSSRWSTPPGRLSSIFLMTYGWLRIFAEFFRMPDMHIWYLFSTSWLTLGMLYSLPMILCGLIIYRLCSRVSPVAEHQEKYIR